MARIDTDQTTYFSCLKGEEEELFYILEVRDFGDFGEWEEKTPLYSPKSPKSPPPNTPTQLPGHLERGVYAWWKETYHAR